MLPGRMKRMNENIRKFRDGQGPRHKSFIKDVWTKNISGYNITINGGGEDFPFKVEKNGKIVFEGESKSLSEAFSQAESKIREMSKDSSNEENEIYYPDKNIEEADWTKKSWDLPPYKSKDFMKVVKDLNSFRKLPVYKNAVKKGLIKDDKWVGNKKESKDGGPGSGIKGHTTAEEANSEHRKGKKTGEFLITLSGGSIGEKKGETYKGLKVVKKFKTKEEAINYQKFMNKLLSPGDKKYYGKKYNVHAI